MYKVLKKKGTRLYIAQQEQQKVFNQHKSYNRSFWRKTDFYYLRTFDERRYCEWVSSLNVNIEVELNRTIQ